LSDEVGRHGSNKRDVDELFEEWFEVEEVENLSAEGREYNYSSRLKCFMIFNVDFTDLQDVPHR
jgi:hypothetical protein